MICISWCNTDNQFNNFCKFCFKKYCSYSNNIYIITLKIKTRHRHTSSDPNKAYNIHP